MFLAYFSALLTDVDRWEGVDHYDHRSIVRSQPRLSGCLRILLTTLDSSLFFLSLEARRRQGWLVGSKLREDFGEVEWSSG